MASLEYPRWKAACGVITDGGDGEQIVAVVGRKMPGSADGVAVYDRSNDVWTEALTIEAPWHWKSYYYGITSSDGGTLYAIEREQYGQHMTAITCANRVCSYSFITSVFQPQIPRSSVMTKVPSRFATCEEKEEI